MASKFDEELERKIREAVQPDPSREPDPVNQPTPDEALIKTHSQDVRDWNPDINKAREQEQAAATSHNELLRELAAEYKSTGNHEHEKDIQYDRDLER
jgi:hypothetical protein